MAAITGAPATKASSSSEYGGHLEGMMNIFRGKAEDILRVLLVKYPKTWTLREICKEADVSLRWASVVSKVLINERIALRDTDRGGLRIMAPEDLLRRWANYRNFAANTRFLDYYMEEDDISALFSRFKGKQGPEYAFTCLAGGLLAAPFVRPANAHIYVRNEESAKHWAEMLHLQPVEKNGNVKFAIAGNSDVFYGSYPISGTRVVSDVQLYVDLLNYPGRGEEAAGEILKKIEKNWKLRE
ncbi:MAG: type IV toxin-antitoxin system AbiEi family antitoxin [Candidatus Micrarchaeota archaeon]|nr:type IV toxin-antitoxin system AbiEi family antitoxin [Candidatus Micrarchaeota archaeon]